MVFAAAAIGVTAAVGVAGSAISAKKQSDAAKSAAGAQRDASFEALNFEREQWYNQQQQLAPWLEAGGRARETLETRAGQSWPRWQAPNEVMPATTGAWTRGAVVDPNGYRFDPAAYAYQRPAPVDPNAHRFQSPTALDPNAYRYSPRQAMDPGQYAYNPRSAAELGTFDFKPPTVTDDPGYQFRLRQGVGALDASAAARGNLLSGAAQKGLLRYGQELGSQEYEAAYGRSWQQQQEAHQRRVLANMTQEERERYANQAAYGRGLTADMTQEERDRYANQASYARGLTADEMAYQRAFGENTQRYDWARQQQETDFTQGLTANELGYGRGLTANQQDYARALQANETIEQRNLYENQSWYDRTMAQQELEHARAWQAYAADAEESQQYWNRYGQLAGYGLGATSQLGQLGNAYAARAGDLATQRGNAQAAGIMGSANAWSQGITGATNALSSGVGNYAFLQGMQRQPQYGAPAQPYAPSPYAPQGNPNWWRN